MTDEEVGAIWRDECAKADHITWAATAFARRIEAVEREQCAKVWVHHAYAALGMQRDSMSAADIETVQRFLGPLEA